MSPIAMGLMLLFAVAGEGHASQSECIPTAHHTGAIAFLGSRGLFSGGAHDVEVAGGFAYALVGGFSGGNLVVIDRATNSVSGFIAALGSNLELADSCAYVASGHFTSSENSLRVIDVATPSAPNLLATVDIGDPPHVYSDVAVSGGYAYVVDGKIGLSVVDVSIPADAAVIATSEIPGGAFHVDAAGSHVYVLGSALTVVDVSDVTQPRIVGTVAVFGQRGHSAVKIVGSQAYVLGAQMYIVDVAEPTAPSVVGTLELDGVDIAVDGAYAYVAPSTGVTIVDITNPAAPVVTRQLKTLGFPTAIDSERGIAYVADGYVASGPVDSPPPFVGVEVIDVAHLDTPAALGAVGFDDVDRVALSSGYAYVSGRDGIHIVEIASIQSVGMFATAAEGFANVADIASFGNDLFIVDHDPTTTRAGLHIFDLSSASDPQLVGSVELGGTGAAVQLVVESNLAYVRHESPTSVELVDISIPSSPAVVGIIDNVEQDVGLDVEPIRSFGVAAGHVYVPWVWYDEIGAPPVPNRGYVAYDATQPSRPLAAKRSHTSVDVITGFGNYAFFAGAAELSVQELSDPSQPAQIGGLWTTAAGEVVVAGSYAYMIDGLRDIQAFDITRLDRPISVGKISTTIVISDVAADNGRIYVVGRGGLAIYPAVCPTDPTPVEVSEFNAAVLANGVQLTWQVTSAALAELLWVHVQSAPEVVGPYSTRTSAPLVPERAMRFYDEGAGRSSTWYRLMLENVDGSIEFAGPVFVAGAVPISTGLSAAHPVERGLSVSYRIASDVQTVDLSIYDVRGRLVQVLHRGPHPAGMHNVVWGWSGERPSGVFFVRLLADSQTSARKAVLVR